MSPIPVITQNEKYCTDCGKVILRRAEICPNCGCRQSAPPPSASSFTLPSMPSMPSSTGKFAALLIGNILWNGLGNLLIGDNRGWKWGFVNWLLFFLSLFTFGIPCILGCIYCTSMGAEFLRAHPDSAQPQESPHLRQA